MRKEGEREERGGRSGKVRREKEGRCRKGEGAGRKGGKLARR